MTGNEKFFSVTVGLGLLVVIAMRLFFIQRALEVLAGIK